MLQKLLNQQTAKTEITTTSVNNIAVDIRVIPNVIYAFTQYYNYW